MNGQVIKNLPICLGQVAIEIAACYKIHIIYEIICSCSKASKIENNAECSDEIDPPEITVDRMECELDCNRSEKR